MADQYDFSPRYRVPINAYQGIPDRWGGALESLMQGLQQGQTQAQSAAEMLQKKRMMQQAVQNMQQQEPDDRTMQMLAPFIQANPDLASKILPELAKGAMRQQPQQSLTLDSILANKVKSGEVGIEEAYRLRERPVAPKVDAGDNYLKRKVIDARVSLAKARPLVESAIKEIDRVIPLNENSYGGRTGSFAMKGMSAANVGTKGKKFTNTSDVLNTMQQQVSRVLKSVFGGQLSDGERQYLNTVYGALPDMTPSERKIAMTNVKTMLRAKVSGEQNTVNELIAASGSGNLNGGDGGGEDFANMSEEDLQAIASGAK